MNYQLDGFEPGDLVRVRKSTTSSRVGDTIWEVTALADDGRTVVMERTAYGKTHTARARAAMLWLVKTAGEILAEELMRKPEPPAKPSKLGRPDAFGAGLQLRDFKTAVAGKKLRIDDANVGFEARFHVLKRRIP